MSLAMQISVSCFNRIMKFHKVERAVQKKKNIGTCSYICVSIVEPCSKVFINIQYLSKLFCDALLEQSKDPLPIRFIYVLILTNITHPIYYSGSQGKVGFLLKKKNIIKGESGVLKIDSYRSFMTLFF